MKIGIWGFGVVGKSTAQFLLNYKHNFTNIALEVFDNRTLTETEQLYCHQNNIAIAAHSMPPSKELPTKDQNLANFLEHNDVIIPSPGIKLDPVYHNYSDKWLSELDLFAQFFTKKIIAITGSVGKTSITSLLSDLLHKMNTPVLTGGNIGKACLDLIPYQDTASYALLEVSSFQLAYTKNFTPDIAIITNIFPNHLDWHKDEEDYFKAKCAIFARQNAYQKSFMPFNLRKRIYAQHLLASQCFFFSSTPLSAEEYASLEDHETIFYINQEHTHIIQYNTDTHTHIIALEALPAITFDYNWLIICSVLYSMGFNINNILLYAQTLSIPEHRLEKCAHINGVTIYNDSKSTTPQSTQAAIMQLQKHPIILILGGLSKGVDREPLIIFLKNKVKAVYTFGHESASLAAMCKKHTIPAYEHISLESTASEVLHAAIPGDQIVFSPAGSSYDLFKNYIERGLCFKKLVNEYESACKKD